MCLNDSTHRAEYGGGLLFLGRHRERSLLDIRSSKNRILKIRFLGKFRRHIVKNKKLWSKNYFDED